MKLPIHAAVIIHDEGATQYVSASHEKLIDRIADRCREHWSSVSADQPPPDASSLVFLYFCDSEDDSLELTEDSIELPEPYASGPKLLDQLKRILAAIAAYQPGNGNTYTALCGEIANASAIIAKASVPSVPSIQHFTIFCQQSDDLGTIHIDSVEAPDLESAIIIGRRQCLDDWNGDQAGKDAAFTLEDIHCLGVAEGNIRILHWDDQVD